MNLNYRSCRTSIPKKRRGNHKQTEEVWGSREKFSGRNEGAERGIRLFKARGPLELGQVASGSATQGVGLKNENVGSQVVGEDRSRRSGKRTVGKVGGGGR